MESLVVPRIHGSGSPVGELSRQLRREGAKSALGYVPWPDFPYHPEVVFRIGHTGTEILIEFEVCEQSVRALATLTNSAVSEDSCVELFVAKELGGAYYNIELSCIGTCLVGYGAARQGRELLRPELIAAIERQSSLGTEPFEERFGTIRWTLAAVIPLSLLQALKLPALDGRTLFANLYKCGDRLSAPHYAVWNPIPSGRPDYHRPESFGRLSFAPDENDDVSK
ncbi:MAG TPA: carbohydrate-binding family 9-like protein [Spirochaetia bacterium]|nr:carbohydrate-binding family 9-like protein [Spirochaetia bacterium]